MTRTTHAAGPHWCPIGQAHWQQRVLLAAFIAMLSACTSTRTSDDRSTGNTAKDVRDSKASVAPATGLEAPLVPVGGSAIQGSVRFVTRGGGVTMLVYVAGMGAGPHRVIVHASGNCTSPNGFSAGPPWAPDNAVPQLTDRMPVLTPNADGYAMATVRLAGVTLASLEKKSVVVHEGAYGPFETSAGVRNNRVGCGVVGALRTLF